MKKQSSAVLVAALLVCGAAHAQSSAQLWASAQPMPSTTTGPTLGVGQGGSAPVETALATIIPQPYRIELDARVPTTMIVNWTQGEDWMQVLQTALGPLGLVATPNWSTNTILVTLRAQPAPVANPLAATATAPAQTPAMTPAANSEVAVAATPITSLSTPPEAMQAAQGTPPVVDPIVGATDPAWNHPAPKMPDHPVTLSDAVMRLMPLSMTGTQLEIEAVNDAAKVGWLNGQTRIEAMRTVLLSRGLHAVIQGQNMKISPVAPIAAMAKQASKAEHRPAQGPAIVAMPTVSVQHWTIDDGQAISDALKDWAKKAGWSVVWNLHDDWSAPHATDFTGNFVDAAGDAIKALANNGADVRGTFYQTNKTLVVSAGGSHE